MPFQIPQLQPHMSHSPLQYTSTLTPTSLPPQLGSMPTTHLVQLPPTIQSIPTSTQLHPFQQPTPLQLGVYQPCLLHHHPTHPFGHKLSPHKLLHLQAPLLSVLSQYQPTTGTSADPGPLCVSPPVPKAFRSTSRQTFCNLFHSTDSGRFYVQF